MSSKASSWSLPRGSTFALCGMLICGCYAGIGGDVEGGSATGGGQDPPAQGSTGGPDDGGTPNEDNECGAQRTVGPTPLRRLTRREYDNTIRDLTGAELGLANAFPADEKLAGFDANAVSLVSLDHVEDYVWAAQDVAAFVVESRLDEWISCDRTDEDCVRQFIAWFGRRAFRRPLETSELDALVGAWNQGQIEWGPDEALATVIEGMLASPFFVYHVELGEADEGGARRLRPMELASRLSYYLWASMPDDALLNAAQAGELATPEGLSEQARRMLDDPKAAHTLASFHEQWLGTEGLDGQFKDPDAFPQWNPELAAKMRRETNDFAQDVILNGDARLETLLTATYSIVDPEVAALYGVSAPPASGRVMLDPTQRAGLLTHPGVLASHAHATGTSIVRRGRLVRERILCQAIPPPPGDAMLNDPDDSVTRLDNPQCAGCHQLMDPIGLGFEAYDPLGVYRIVDAAGLPLDPQGEIIGAGGDLDGAFLGPVELAQRLASSDQAADCIALHWLRYATRRDPSEDDACAVEMVTERFRDDRDIRELIIDIVTTDAFRLRTTIE